MRRLAGSLKVATVIVEFRELRSLSTPGPGVAPGYGKGFTLIELLVVIVIIAILAASARAAVPGPIEEKTKQQLMPHLTDLCDWIMTLDVGSGHLKTTHDTDWSVFINANLARTLVAGYKITTNSAYLNEALRWCDTFVEQQRPIITSHGEAAGYWADAGATGNLYLADGGTAATALAVISRSTDRVRQQKYRAALERYSLFVRHGCREDPQGQGRAASPGWIIASGSDRGAVGCGYYRGHRSIAPYIIASGVNGGAFHALLYSITKDSEHARLSAGAVRWILAQRQADGQFPYLIDGQPPDFTLPLLAMTYCSEGLIAAWTHQVDPDLQKQILRETAPCVEWLLRSQNPDDSWGAPQSYDQQRSPGVVTLLAWHYRAANPDPRIARAAMRYCQFLLVPANSKAYGVKHLVRTSGFVGLAVADLIQPGATF